MPLAGGPGEPRSFLEAFVPLLHMPVHPAGVVVAEIVTLPGQVVISFLLVLAAARRLWTRGRVEAAVCWTAAWIAAVAVEVAVRHTLVRPRLYEHGVHLVGFDMPWPSGHTLRCALVACALGAAWPRLRVALGIWLLTAVALLELAGFHTVTDVVGGLLLATAAAASAVELERSGFLRRRARLGRVRTGA
jgi:membrane-associated phospholipid phosphatase